MSRRDNPTVVVVEEGMREGMQIESADIPVDAKIELLDALSATGLRHIVVGSFVSPKWVPQMARIEEVIAGFTPREGVTYTALALNARGVERRAEHTPPLSPPDGIGRSMIHLCDVFVQRNSARSTADERTALPDIVAAAVARGVREATVAVNAAWGSNWLGTFTQEERIAALAEQRDEWAAAGVPTTGVYLGDPMSFNTPGDVAAMVAWVRDHWPEVRTVHLHLHDGRGAALTSAWAALRELGPEHTLVIDASIGGMGGCPYCGNGRATKMIPTEDLVEMLRGEGIDTGIDLDALIEAAHLAEKVVGHELYGRVSKAGPRPGPDRLYPMDMPLVETIDSAQHFRLGPGVYAGNPAPWKKPITSEARDAVEREIS
ncbi:beta/alpha barrel domain-containing protein [Prauserella flavalba]|uniref:citramalate synthase n=1 Tax=Prauserella flavalba TaxID=1477506 RepID=UPI0036E12FF6